MTDRIALGIGLVLAAVIAADLFFFGWNLHLFLGRQLDGLIDYVSFWR